MSSSPNEMDNDTLAAQIPGVDNEEGQREIAEEVPTVVLNDKTVTNNDGEELDKDEQEATLSSATVAKRNTSLSVKVEGVEFIEDDDGPRIPPAFINGNEDDDVKDSSGPNLELVDHEDNGPIIPPAFVSGNDDNDCRKKNAGKVEIIEDDNGPVSMFEDPVDDVVIKKKAKRVDSISNPPHFIEDEGLGSVYPGSDNNRENLDTRPHTNEAAGMVDDYIEDDSTPTQDNDIHIPEAFLVEDLEPAVIRQTVYVATPIIPWWKQKKGLYIGIIVLIIGAVAAVLGVLFGRPSTTTTTPEEVYTETAETMDLGSAETSLVPTSSPIKLSPPLMVGISDVIHLNDLFETDCDNDCGPITAIDNDIAVVSPDSGYQYIDILTKAVNGSTFEAIQRIDLNLYPRSLDIHNEVIVAGSPWEVLETGAVYTYERNASTGLWNQMQRITAVDGQVDAEFGISVGIYEDVLVAGAFQDREGNIGSAYIYRKDPFTSKWELEQKLAPIDDKIVHFGMTVAIKGDIVAIGDRAYEVDSPNKKGGVFIYRYTLSSENWVEFDVITNKDCDNWFGVSIAFTYDHDLLVGCPHGDGSVYYYTQSRTGYIFHQKIIPSKGKGYRFGNMNQLSVHGNLMVVGSSRSNDGVYLFLRLNGVWLETWNIPSPGDSQAFGRNVAVSGVNVLVSSKRNANFYEVDEGVSTVRCILPPKEEELLFDADCTRCNLYLNRCNRCRPFVAIDGGSSVISRNTKQLHILSGGIDVLFGSDHDFSGLAISGDVVVASALNNKDGSVRLIQRKFGFWQELQLSPDALTPNVNFGTTVDIHGGVIVVGARDDTINHGSIYIFRLNESSWEQETNLLPDDPNLKGFGKAVSIVGNTVAVSDHIYNGSTGAVFVHVYEPSSRSWSHLLNETITNEDCDSLFGSSVSLNTDGGLMIGCPGDEDNTGAVYYYMPSDSDGGRYILQQKITAMDGMPNNKFGNINQIAVDGDIMVVGNYKETNGTVHVFAQIMNSTWVEVTTLRSPPEIDGFGFKVALSGNKVLVSSIYNVFSYTLEECNS